MSATTIRADLSKLKTMLSRGFRATGVEVTFNPDPANPGAVRPHAVVSVENGKDVLRLESDDFDFSMYSLSLHAARDQAGTRQLRPIANSNRFWEEMEQLCRDADSKRLAAFKRIDSGAFRFDYNPQSLLTKFLASRDWGSSEFTPLKRDHFEIQAYFLRYVQQLLETKKQMHARKPATKQYEDIVDEILMKAFRTDVDFVNNYLRFHDLAKLDVEDAIVQASQQHKIVEDLIGMLAARGTVDGAVGIPHLLDIYRRLAESTVPFIRTISDAICIANGRPLPDTSLGYAKRCDIVRSSPYARLLDCLDPEIRHSESHTATKVDKPAGKVFLTEVIDGRRTILREYTFKQVADMTRELQDALFPALLMAFYMHELVCILVILMSREYVELLLNIDNLAGADFNGMG